LSARSAALTSTATAETQQSSVNDTPGTSAMKYMHADASCDQEACSAKACIRILPDRAVVCTSWRCRRSTPHSAARESAVASSSARTPKMPTPAAIAMSRTIAAMMPRTMATIASAPRPAPATMAVFCATVSACESVPLLRSDQYVGAAVGAVGAALGADVGATDGE